MGNLENITTEYLREVLREVDDPDAVKRLMVAIAYKELDELSQNGAAELFGFSSGWASRWFRQLERLEDEPFEEVVSNDPRPGRPAKLSESERQEFESALQKPPSAVGLEGTDWTVVLARRYLKQTFGVEYSTRHVRRMMRNAGLSCEQADTDPTNGSYATEPESEGERSKRTIWRPGPHP